MFFCSTCAKRNDWPESFHQSFGPCELCGAHTICNDIPSRELPLPNEHSTRYLEELDVDG